MTPKIIRVKLVKELTGELPLGSYGTVLKGSPSEPGMSLVRWDKTQWVIPMFNSEIDIVKPLL